MLRTLKRFCIDSAHLMGVYWPAKLTPKERQVLGLISPDSMMASSDGTILAHLSHQTGKPREGLGWLLSLLHKFEATGLVERDSGPLGITVWYRTSRGTKYATA